MKWRSQFYPSVDTLLFGCPVVCHRPLSEGLRICWLYPLQRHESPTSQKRGVWSMSLNCIWWWCSNSGALGSCHYSQFYSDLEWWYLLGSHLWVEWICLPIICIRKNTWYHITMCKSSWETTTQKGKYKFKSISQSYALDEQNTNCTYTLYCRRCWKISHIILNTYNQRQKGFFSRSWLQF